jgi:hypothetical protein
MALAFAAGTSTFVAAAAKSDSPWFSALSFIGERSLPEFSRRLVGIRASIPRESTPPLVLAVDPFPRGTVPGEWWPILSALSTPAAVFAVQSCTCPASYDTAGATVQYFDGTSPLDAHPGLYSVGQHANAYLLVL